MFWMAPLFATEPPSAVEWLVFGAVIAVAVFADSRRRCREPRVWKDQVRRARRRLTPWHATLIRRESELLDELQHVRQALR